MSRSKADIIEVYKTFKAKAGGRSPLYRDFLAQSAIPRHELERLFGASPYSKLQELAGDRPNKLNLEATSLNEIMANYGALASEILRTEGRLPVAADWRHKDLRPTESGLSRVHGIRWSEFPEKFAAFCAEEESLKSSYTAVLEYIGEHQETNSRRQSDASTILLDHLSGEIRNWAPALRRNSEEAYKSELSLHLRNSKQIKGCGLEVREERGDSQCDIAIGSKVAIELKKSPSQSDYDRCFGQVARHLQTYEYVIVVIFDVTRRDSFEDFNKLVDLYFANRVRVIRDG